MCDVSVLNVACFVAGLSAAVSLFSGGAVPPSCRILFQPLEKKNNWKVFPLLPRLILLAVSLPKQISTEETFLLFKMGIFMIWIDGFI